nr:MAG TPA: Repressor protein CI [Caudoviricetes sp.]
MLSNNIRKFRIENNWTQKELANKLHVGKTTISNYETGYSEPDIENQLLLADLFNVSLDELNSRQTKDVFKVPVLGSVPCGEPYIADEEILDWEEINPKLKGTGDYFGLRLRGNSMEPRFAEGDVVIVKKQSDIESGEIAIVRVNGDEATMKIVQKSPQGITLVATNPSVYPPHFYTNEQIQLLPVSIVGKVIELRAKF